MAVDAPRAGAAAPTRSGVAPPSGPFGSRWRLPLIVCGVGLALAAAIGVRQVRMHDAQERERFAALAGRALERLEERLRVYEYGVRSARGFVLGRGVDALSVAAFRQYADSRDFASSPARSATGSSAASPPATKPGSSRRRGPTRAAASASERSRRMSASGT